MKRLLFIILLLTISSTALLAQEATPEPTPDSQAVLREAQEANADAERAIGFAESLLSFIEGASVFLTIFVTAVAAISAIVNLRNNAQIRRELQDELRRNRAELDENRAQLSDELTRVRQTQDQTRSETNAALSEIRNLQTDVRQSLNDLDRVVQQGLSDIERNREVVDQRLQELQQLRQEIDPLREAFNTGLTEIRHLNEQVNQRMTERLESIERRNDIRLDEITAANNNVNRAVGLTQLAQQQISIGNLNAAAQSLDSAIERDDDNSVVKYFLGDVYLRLGRLDEAIEFLTEAMEGDDDYPDAEAAYAYALRLQGDRAEDDELTRDRYYARSLDLFISLYEKHPELLDLSGESVYGALASLYRRQGDIDKAIRWYERVRKITPTNSYPVNNLALLNYRKGNIDRAKHYFQQSFTMANRSLNLTPADYWRWFDYITAELALQKVSTERVRDHLSRVFELNPGLDPLSKYMDGLLDLKQSPEPPPGVDVVIAHVQQEIDKLEE